MSHLVDQPAQKGRTFKLKGNAYNLSHSYGHWTLRKVIDGKVHEKPEISNKKDESIFMYLAATERCTYDDARGAYESTNRTV